MSKLGKAVKEGQKCIDENIKNKKRFKIKSLGVVV